MRGVVTLSVLAALVSLLALGGYVVGSKDTSSSEVVTLIVTTLGKTTTERFDVSDLSALDVLEATHDVRITSSYIKCIDDVCVSKDHQWVYYVNGKMMPKSASNYMVKRGDIIEFRFGKQ